MKTEESIEEWLMNEWQVTSVNNWKIKVWWFESEEFEITHELLNTILKRSEFWDKIRQICRLN